MGLKSYLKKLRNEIRKTFQKNKIIVNIVQVDYQKQLVGRNIMITGGGRGLGYEMAKKCISQGAKVLLVGRNEENLREACNNLGENSMYLVFDVQNVNKFGELLEEAANKFNHEKIDSLISNAGISYHEGNFRNVTENGWDEQFATNLKGNYFLVSEFIKYLETFDNKKGNIVVITSERAKRADDIPYGLTKVASNSFIQAIASKVIEEGIRINGVAPGVTASEMTGFSKEDNLYVEYQPTKRIFLPEEVAEVVNFLLSDVSNCISGEIVTCDQGRYITHW